MDFLLQTHSGYRWIVLAVLLGVGTLGLVRSAQGAAWSKNAERPFMLATIVFDLQIGLGIALWIGNKGWDQDFFIKFIHPLGMILAAGVAHMAVMRARKGDPAKAFRMAGIGLLAAPVIVAAVVPRDAWF